MVKASPEKEQRNRAAMTEERVYEAFIVVVR